jgi:poly(A)-specific ribonuclease
VLEETHPELTASKTADDRIKVVKMDEEARLAHQQAAAEEDLKKFETAMGMRLLFNDLVAAKKPLVGHNCFFDILFMMSWFDGPLPDTMSAFKTKVRDPPPVHHIVASIVVITSSRSEFSSTPCSPSCTTRNGSTRA